ncbi:MAG: glucan biosynthesis protein [Acidiferrobacter sp.]
MLEKSSLTQAAGMAAMIFTLAGCALPSTVHHARVQAHQALTASQQALAAVQAQAVDERRTERALWAELAALAAREAALANAVQAVRHPSTPPPPTAPMHQARLRANPVFTQVQARAQALAHQAYQPPVPVAPALRALSFVDYGKVTLAGRVPDWPVGTRFHLQLYPAGYLFTWPEKIYVTTHGVATAVHLPVVVRGDAALAQKIGGVVPPAGFSVYTPFTQGTSINEFLSFLGASYFRAVGAGQSWGLSARGVAVDTALAHRAEEFPYFRSFWIIPPRPDSRRLSFCALLDSPSLTGAYRFVVTPGVTTVVDVKVVLFERRAVRRLGIAPLTSMFLQGRFSNRRFRKLIRGAHDSDGLSIDTGNGGRLWWPLRNPKRLALYRFPLTNPQGFGLMQRARRGQDYRAFGMHYEDRPNAWVTPEGHWGSGHLLLVELPTNSQTNDNISVFWVADTHAHPGTPLTFSYRIAWSGSDPVGRHLGYVSASRHAFGKNGQETYVVNFRGTRLQGLAALTPVIHVWGPARATKDWVAWDPAGHDWRLQFTIVPTASGAVTVHAALADGGARVTETWADIFPLH